jgi:2-desacetyl-2-hydroxyethyl bacteriochlorophyllide A dehydrogenase
MYKRIVYPQKGCVEVEEFSLPDTLRENEVLVKTEFTLISPGTERAWLLALPDTPGKFPQYHGYSSVGIVEKVGKNVKGFKIGDRAASLTKHQSHIIVPEEKLYKIPHGLSFEEAVFFCVGQIALQGVRKARIELGETVVVLGQGIIGNLALQLAKTSGATTIACDLDEKRLKLSSLCGADYSFSKNMEEEVKKVTEGKMANVVVEATGNPKAIPSSFCLASKMGKIILLGSPRGETTVNFYPEIHCKGISVIGAHTASRISELRDDINIVLKLIKVGSLKVKPLISTIVDYNKAESIYLKITKEPDVFLGVLFKW